MLALRMHNPRTDKKALPHGITLAEALGNSAMRQPLFSSSDVFADMEILPASEYERFRSA
jgi:hypothetical protein